MAENIALEAATPGLTKHRASLDALTGIRFFAALYVVLFHSRLASLAAERGYRLGGNFFANGYLAVVLFFILSGFILAYTYEGQIERRGDARRFWEARFARIWPAYAVSLVAISLPLFNFPKPGAMAACLLMVQSWDPLSVPLSGAWNAVCWTLSAEAFFYLCFPWLQIGLEKLSGRLLGFALGAAALVCVGINSAPRTFGYVPQGVWRWVPLALAHTPEFVVGVALGNVFLRWARVRGTLGKAGNGVGNGAWTYGTALVVLGLLCMGQGRWTSVTVPAFAALVFGLAAERSVLRRVLSTRVLLVGGGISYSMYLMQLPVKFWVNEAAPHVGLANVEARLGINLLLLIGISLILFYGVENPARRLIRGAFAALGSSRYREPQGKKASQ